MRILVTSAVESETAKWRGAPEFRKSIDIVRTGIGMRLPQDDLRRAISSRIDVCIASGLAGSLSRQYKVGTVVVARGIKSAGSTTILPCDGGLIDAAVRCGAQPVDFFYTTSRIVNTDVERAKLSLFADAADMESFHILSEARRAGIPAVAVRAISDSPERKIPIDFTRVINDRGRIAWPRMAGELIRHPGRVPAFVRFGIDSSTAIRNLTTFLDRYVSLLMTTETNFRTTAEHATK